MRTTKEHMAELRRVFLGMNDELLEAVVADLEAAELYREAILAVSIGIRWAGIRVGVWQQTQWAEQLEAALNESTNGPTNRHNEPSTQPEQLSDGL